MQRRIEQANSHRTASHSLEDTLEVGLLVGKDLLQSLLAPLCILCQNHLTHRLDLLTLEEHVLRTAKTDTYGTETTCDSRIMRRVGVGAYTQFGIFIAKIHQLGEIA